MNFTSRPFILLIKDIAALKEHTQVVNLVAASQLWSLQSKGDASFGGIPPGLKGNQLDKGCFAARKNDTEKSLFILTSSYLWLTSASLNLNSVGSIPRTLVLHSLSRQ